MKKCTIIGCGPGSEDYLTPAACRAVEHASVIVGTKRLLELFPKSPAEKVAVGARIEEVLDLVALRQDSDSIVFLVTGDPGIFSLSKLVVKRFGRDSCEVIPGISSVQAAFAKLALDWADARIISAHKENPSDQEWSSVGASDKIAVLAGRKAALEWLAAAVPELEGRRRIFVCEDLTLASEKVYETTAKELADVELSSRTIILIIKSEILE
jgi:precorrin-6y C5,15-methyltransferase (decarboxylating) CbiE subunit